MLKHLHLGYLGYHRSANVEGVNHANIVIGNLLENCTPYIRSYIAIVWVHIIYNPYVLICLV